MSAASSPPPPGADIWEDSPLPGLLLDRRGRVLGANRAARRMLRAEGERLAGRPAEELFSPAPPLAAALGARGGPKPGAAVEGRLAPFEGPPIPVALRLQPLPARGRSGRALAWVEDRSDLQELQRRLEHSERLSAMAIVAGKVAHEIRTPLNSIFLNNDLLRERVERMRGTQGQRLLRYCRILEEEVERLNEIVESYLALARLAGGERQETDVAEFLASFVDEVRGDYAARGVGIATALRAVPSRIRIDRRQFRRVLLNLFANSRDAMKGGGTITLSTEDAPGGYRITVSDTGEGIPPEALSLLSTPFTTYKENGSGLGLFLAREILQRHGGRLELRSLHGEGTSVILTLPYR